MYENVDWTELRQDRSSGILLLTWYRKFRLTLRFGCSETWCYIGEHLNRHQHRCDTLKCRITISFQGRVMHHGVKFI